MGTNKLRTRAEIPAQYKWNMQDLFASDELWEEEAQLVLDLAKEAESCYKGRLSESASTLLDFFKKIDEIDYHAERVIVYANQKYHEDTAVSKYQAYCAKADSIGVALASAKSFMEPELLAMDEAVLEQFYKDEPGLEHYRRMVDKIYRDKEHTLSAEMEAVLAQARDMANVPSNIFSMFNNADLKFPSVRDVEGNRIQITHGNYISLIERADRGLRKDVFRAMYNEYKKHANTVAAMFQGHLKQEAFYAKVRKYSSDLEAALDGSHIPVSVYENLIHAVHEAFPMMHRYVKLRKKLLGVDELHMYDLYVPMVADAGSRISFEQAKEIVLEGLKPMGDEYVSLLKEGFEHGWIDVYENQGKRSGAYSWGAYGTHPYVLLNYQENLNNVFTLAHEMGHALHSWYSDEYQPYIYAGYKIFVAEVASTCNEALLIHYLMETTEDKKQKAYLINYFLEQFRTTLFRQTMFAEFEKMTHGLQEQGETLTADRLCEIYYGLNRDYFGNDICVDQEIEMEWARIPHFYTPFYVYQYATGFSAAIALSSRILEQGESAVEDYKKFLKGGSSMYPLDLLRMAGVDMERREPVENALKVFEQYLNEMERLMEYDAV